MSKKVDAVTDYLEKNWGAKPMKMGSVVKPASKVFHVAKPKAEATPDGIGGMTYTADQAAADAAKEVKEMQIHETGVTKVPKGTFDVSKLLTAPTVTMMKATKLYQPVKGTSAGSRYFMIAIGPALRVAVRWKTGPSTESLALRVEGSGLGNPYTVKMLEQIGLDTKSATHMSAHLTAANDIEARKALGALLFAINEPWTTPMPDPAVVCV
jgi:hypothetical protein